MKTMTAVPGSGRRWVERRRVEATVATVVIVVVMFMLALVLVLVLVVLVVVGVGVGVEVKNCDQRAWYHRAANRRNARGSNVSLRFVIKYTCRSRNRSDN